MKHASRLIVAVLIVKAVFVTGFAAAGTAPDPDSIDLTNTRWTVTYDDPKVGHREYDVIFRPNGELTNVYTNDTPPENDSWEQRGKVVIMRFNGGFAIYEGEIRDSNNMSGEASNRMGGKWAWKACRKK